MMNDAEKRLHKLSQKDHDAFRRAKAIGLQLDYSALEHYIQKNFLNQEIEHHHYEPCPKNVVTNEISPSNTLTQPLHKSNHD